MNQPDRGYKSQTFTRPAVSDVFGYMSVSPKIVQTHRSIQLGCQD